jgi:hypothetical protein
MQKEVVCTKCRRQFLIEGGAGTMREALNSVTCPYCQEPNEVGWLIDGGEFQIRTLEP